MLRRPIKLQVCVMSKEDKDNLEISNKSYTGSYDDLEVKDHYFLTIDHFYDDTSEIENNSYTVIYSGSDCIVAKISISDLIQLINNTNNLISLN